MSGAAAQRGSGAGYGPAPDALAPLRTPLFRAIFVATAISNVGTWMQQVGRAWLMTDLTTSATLIALLQSAAMVVVVLPAGIMADLSDRRRLILAGHIWLIAVSAALALVAAFGLATPALILALTFAAGVGWRAGGFCRGARRLCAERDLFRRGVGGVSGLAPPSAARAHHAA